MEYGSLSALAVSSKNDGELLVVALIHTATAAATASTM